jgi:uncharacterized SAM-binding protein YcdF (DUF218 family)
LSLLVYPLTQALLLLLAALMLRRFVRLATGCLLLATAWLYLCSTAWFADLLMGQLEDGFRPKALSVIPQADAIVLLGGATRGDAHLGGLGDLNQQADRIVHALQLFRAGKAPLILLSGGAGPDSRPEAELMYEHLELMGVSPRSMLRERESRDTRENALYSATLLRGKGVRSILLVTSGFHMRRAVPLFEAQGFQVIPAPTDFQRLVGKAVLPRWLPTADDLVRTTYAVREFVGYQVYRWRGWIS